MCRVHGRCPRPSVKAVWGFERVGEVDGGPFDNGEGEVGHRAVSDKEGTPVNVVVLSGDGEDTPA